MIGDLAGIDFKAYVDAPTPYVWTSATLSPPPEAFPLVVRSQDETEYVKVLERQSSDYDMAGQRLLHDAVDRIQYLQPFAADGQTQKLLNAAVQRRRTETPGDVDAWASRLADDVKAADD